MPLDQKPASDKFLGYYKAPLRLAPFLERDPGCYLLDVRGNCMSPDLEDGDLALVSPALDPEPGQLVALEKEGNQGYAKRLVEAISHFLLPQYASPENEMVARVVVEMNEPRQCLSARADKFKSIRPIVGVIRVSEQTGQPCKRTSSRTVAGTR